MCSTCLFTQGHFHRLGGGLPISTPLAASFSPRAAACGQYLWPVAGSLGHCHFAPLDGRKLMGFHSGEIYPRYLSEYALPSDFIRPGSHARRLWHPRLDQRQRGLLLHGDFAGLFMWWTNVRLGLASPSRLAVLARFGALFVHWIPQLVGHPLLDSKIQQETFRFRQEGSFDAQRGFINTRASISLKLQLRKASFDFFHLFSMMLLRHVFRERYLFLPFSSLLWAASSNSFWGVDVWPVTGFCVSSYWLCLLGLELFCWTAFDQQVPWRQTGLGLGVGLGDVGEIWLALLGSEYSVSMEAWDSTSWRALGRQFKMRWTRRLPNWKPPDPSSIPILKWKPLDQANIPLISSTSHVGVITITLTMIHQLFLYHLIPHVF